MEIAPIILGLLLIAASLGVILSRKPVHSSLFFLGALLTLAGLFLELSAQFIAVMQILVYAGAILVIFMFVIILFQDAYLQIARYESKSSPVLLTSAAAFLILSFFYFAYKLISWKPQSAGVSEDFGNVEPLGQLLYLDFFFPFEAVILLFLISLVGALYIGRKVV